MADEGSQAAMMHAAAAMMAMKIWLRGSGLGCGGVGLGSSAAGCGCVWLMAAWTVAVDPMKVDRFSSVKESGADQWGRAASVAVWGVILPLRSRL